MNTKTPEGDPAPPEARTLELLLAVRGGVAAPEELAELEQTRLEQGAMVAQVTEQLDALRTHRLPAPGPEFTSRVMRACAPPRRASTTGRSRAGGRFQRQVAGQRARSPSLVMARLFAVYLGVAAALLIGRALPDAQAAEVGVPGVTQLEPVTYPALPDAVQPTEKLPGSDQPATSDPASTAPRGR